MSDKEERIRQRAYEKWQKQGEEHGWHDRHWAEAESEIAAEDDKPVRKAGTRKKGAAETTEPMMDDAGLPESNLVTSDGGATAAEAARTSKEAKTKSAAASTTAPETKSAAAAKTTGAKATKSTAKPVAARKPATRKPAKAG
jgi:hypothetical protein